MAGYLSNIIAALEATEHFSTVGRRADLAAALSGSPDFRMADLPAAFVIPPDDEAMPNQTLGRATTQWVTMTLDIVLAISNLTDPSGLGADAVDALDTAKAKVREALHGQEMGAGDTIYTDMDQMVYVGGYKIGYQNSIYWYVVQYSAHAVYSTQL